MRKPMRVVVLSLILVLVCVSMTSAGTKCVTVAGYLFSPQKAWLEQAMECLVDGDKEAVAQMIIDGKVSFFKGGSTVYMTDFTWGGLAKFRLAGDTHEFWTLYEGLEKIE